MYVGSGLEYGSHVVCPQSLAWRWDLLLFFPLSSQWESHDSFILAGGGVLWGS